MRAIVAAMEAVAVPTVPRLEVVDLGHGDRAVEPLLAGVRCPGPRDLPLVDPAVLAGHYYFGSGASLDYITVATGATSTHFVSYAGEYDLRPDGTVTYSYGSASNQGAGTSFGSDGGDGRWTVERDLLVIALDRRPVKRLRIAGLTNYPDATIAVLLDEATAANPTTVGDGRTYYTTKAQ